MRGDIYTQIASALCAAGGIDCIGAADEAGKTAVTYAGTSEQRQYCRGMRKLKMLFSVTGFDANEKQEKLVKRLCDITEALQASSIDVDGVTQEKVSVVMPPMAVMHDGHYWTYTTDIQVTCYYSAQ